MFSLQKLLGKEGKFFDLLEASAEEARSSVQALVRIVKSTTAPPTLEEFVLPRRREKQIAQEISEQLVNTFITGLEREDIEALSTALYKVPKATEKWAEHFIAGSPRQVGMFEQATDTVLAMVRQLRRMQELEKIKELNERLQYIEGEADKLMLELLRDLYSGRHDSLKVVVLKDLYELLERIIDRCRDAGNVINHIVLKNS
ncbi:MAG: DUF47 family protein [Verrucomicrobia bacterium]|nr:MAG: DUF47 family protein [Verrucomicrobiota bacterium]